MILNFNHVLAAAAVDPETVRLARHQDHRIPGRSIYGMWISDGGQQWVEKYQAIQARDVFKGSQYLASFVVTPPPWNETLFIGLYEISSPRTCEAGETDPLTGADIEGFLEYGLIPDDRLDAYRGRLCIDWGDSARSWAQLASAQPKPIRAIRDRVDPPFPRMSQFHIDVDQVLGLYPSWQARLASVKGIYLLVDKDTGDQYVGSAKGDDGIWGRLSDYARTGHGGNAELKNRPAARYRASILEIVDQQLPDDAIEEVESWWKAKLMTREHGLNKN